MQGIPQGKSSPHSKPKEKAESTQEAVRPKRIDPRTFEEQGREELPQIHLGTSSYQMEKKGIQTERGNQNRKIIALNLEFRKLKEELSKLTSWIGSLLGSLQVKYDEYKQTRQDDLRLNKDTASHFCLSLQVEIFQWGGKYVPPRFPSLHF